MALWTAIGMLRQQLGQLPQAMQAYQHALESDPNAAVAANNLAWMYCNSGEDMDKALELARRAKALLPRVATVADTLGWVYYKRQLYDLAVSSLQDAVRQEPNSAEYRVHLAASLLRTGKKDEARAQLMEAFGLNRSLRTRRDVEEILREL